MKMKKILAAVLAGVMALSATACSSSSTKKIESPDDFAGAKISVQTGTTAHDALQKMQPRAHLAQNAVGDLCVFLAEREPVKKRQLLRDWQRSEFRDVQPADRDG